MNTYHEQLAFFQQEWPRLRSALKDGGTDLLHDVVRSYEDPLQRRVIFLQLRQHIREDLDSLGGMDTLVTVAEIGIEEMLSQAKESPPEARASRMNLANIISYNLSADLSIAQVDDDGCRTIDQLERGLKAADDCLKWRKELDKPALAFARAWWVKGVHELALNRYGAAVISLEHFLQAARRAAAEAGQTSKSDEFKNYYVIFATGNLGLARMLDGDESGRTMLYESEQAFSNQLDDPELGGDALLGLGQLRVLHKRCTARE